MSIVAELAERPGVIAAGEYAYRGDRFTYRGHMDDEQARMASVMCRANSMGVHMEADILGSFCEDCGLVPSRGWIVKGPRYTVCVVANVFCFVDNETGDLNGIVRTLRARLAEASDALI